MSRIAVLFLMILAPALAIFLALLGLETLRDNFLGWYLLVLGIAYPAGSIIYYFIRREPFWKSAQAGGRAREETGTVRSGSSCPASWLPSSHHPSSGCTCRLFFRASSGCKSPGWC